MLSWPHSSEVAPPVPRVVSDDAVRDRGEALDLVESCTQLDDRGTGAVSGRALTCSGSLG